MHEQLLQHMCGQGGDVCSARGGRCCLVRAARHWQLGRLHPGLVHHTAAGLNGAATHAKHGSGELPASLTWAPKGWVGGWGSAGQWMGGGQSRSNGGQHGTWVMGHGSWIMDHGLMNHGSWVMGHGLMGHGKGSGCLPGCVNN